MLSMACVHAEAEALLQDSSRSAAKRQPSGNSIARRWADVRRGIAYKRLDQPIMTLLGVR